MRTSGHKRKNSYLIKTTYVPVTFMERGCSREKQSPGLMEANTLARKTDSIQTHDSANVKYHGKKKAREGA